MARENSFSDSDGERSLTPDLDPSQDDEPPRPLPVSVPTPVPVQISTADGHDHRPPPALRQQQQQQHRSSSPVSISKHGTSLRTRISLNRPSGSRANPHPAPFPSSSRYATTPTTTPTEHFRSAVRRVMAMRKTSYVLSGGGTIGAEPGIDPRSEAARRMYGGLRRKCAVEVVDYSPVRAVERRMDNKTFVEFLRDKERSARPAWARVRWINIGGLSWDVISELAIRYKMHPLAVEDLLHHPDRARSKADYYSEHLFLRILCHTLGVPNADSASTMSSGSGSTVPTWSSRAPTLSGAPLTMSPDLIMGDKKDYDIDIDEDDVAESDALAPFDPEAAKPRTPSLLARRRKQRVAQLTLDELKRADRVDVRLSPMCIFLYPDGTVISFVSDPTPTPASESTPTFASDPTPVSTLNPAPTLDFTAPIAARLRVRDSTLRRTADPSLLVQSLLDIIVDRILEVVDEYHRRIQKLERDVLISPKVESVRSLHILSGDLTLHKRTMDPIQRLVYGLRRYDADRYAAAMQIDPDAKHTTGYMSHKSNIYLADVHDHIEYALASLDMYAALTENLIAYAFNMASYSTNQTMRTLTVITVTFFPLTLLTGYFGMNFTGFWSVHNNTDLFFWELAIPLMSVIIPIFLWSDIVRGFQHLKKRLMAREIKKSVKLAAPSPRL